jgi:hypothetical protein
VAGGVGCDVGGKDRHRKLSDAIAYLATAQNVH